MCLQPIYIDFILASISLWFPSFLKSCLMIVVVRECGACVVGGGVCGGVEGPSPVTWAPSCFVIWHQSTKCGVLVGEGRLMRVNPVHCLPPSPHLPPTTTTGWRLFVGSRWALVQIWWRVKANVCHIPARRKWDFLLHPPPPLPPPPPPPLPLPLPPPPPPLCHITNFIFCTSGQQEESETPKQHLSTNNEGAVA